MRTDRTEFGRFINTKRITVKQQIARFYAANLLPEAQSLSRVVKSGAAAILEADSAKL